MRKHQSIVVNGEEFSSKKALQERVRSILHSYRSGNVVNMFDAPFLLSLFSRHPAADQKIGCGVAQIEVRKNLVYTHTQCFWIVRVDGTETDISYRECLSPTSHAQRFANACRAAVEPSTMAFKQRHFDSLSGQPYYCPLTGELLRFVGSHVDHIPPQTFSAILATFITRFDINVDAVVIDGRGIDGSIQDTLRDSVLEQQWIDYHDSVANLRVVSRAGNLSLAKVTA